MRRVLSLFLSCIFVLGVCFSTPIVASAADEGESTTPTTSVGDVFGETSKYEILSEGDVGTPGTCALIKYAGTDAETNITVSATASYNDVLYTVTQINKYAFKGNSTIKAITIPESVTTIEDGAFNVSVVKYVFLKGNTQINGTVPTGVTVHNSGCTPLEESAHTIVDSIITWYCTCGENSTKIPCGHITLVATENATYGGEIPAIKVEKAGTLAVLENMEDSDKSYKLSYDGLSNFYNASVPIDAGTHTATLTYKETITITKEFTIKAKDISEIATVDEIEDQEYTGKAIEPTVVVKDGNDILVKDRDYTVEYSNNTEVSTEDNPATVTITFKGNYSGTVTKEFTIKAKDISEIATVDEIEDQEYTGKAIEPTVVVKDGETVLSSENDYDVSYLNNTNVGTATVTITFKGNYSGTVTKEFTIKAKDISEIATVDEIEDQEHTGKAIEPTVVVKDGETVLSSENDYDVSYLNNTNVGTATVTITFKGNYSGTVTKEFTIKAKDISEIATVDEIEDQEYTGKAIEPTVVVKDGETVLSSENDYDVSYLNNTNVGTATVTITFKGNYSGTVTKEFTIKAKDISEIATVDEIEDQEHTGKAIEPTVVVKDGETVLSSENDYDVSYLNNTNVGTATVTITFKGNYSGTVEKTFEIVAHKHSWSYVADEGSATITATCSGEGDCGVENKTATITLKLPENSDWVYNNSEKKFAFIDGSIDGVTLPEIVYSGDCINAGDYTASITLGDATVSVEFTIEKAPSKLVSVPEINEGLEYSGNFQFLINKDKAGKAEGGVINYKVNNGDWSTEVPSYTAPGTYNVYYKVVGDANHNDTVEEVLSVTIVPKTIDVKALADIEYTGENHDEPEIVFDGTIEGVDVEYSATYMRGEKVETDFKDAGVITVTVSLESEVYIFEGGTSSKELTFEIKKAAASVATVPTANELTYDGKKQDLVTAGSATGGTMQYSLDNKIWNSNIPTAKDAGTYTVYYKVVGDANHSDSAEASISVTIGKAPVTISVETQERVYDGTNAVEIKSATVSDVVSGEEISVKFDGVTATSIEGTGVGTHTVDFEGDFELVGETAGNYEIGAVSGATVTITAKPLIITAKDATVVVNSVMPKFEYTIEGLVDSDSIANVEFVATVENSSTVVENTATVGTYVITPSGAVIEKGDTDVTKNYEITYKTGVFTVTACTKHEWKNSKCEICKIDCEHKYEDGKSAISNKATTQATCVKEGVLLTQCKICDYKAESPLDIVSDAHKMSDWKETVKATCSSTGTEERVCELGCGHKETRPTEKDPDNHTYGDWVITAATCVADGVKVKTCKNKECKHELKETIAKDPTAHKMAAEWEVTKKPTCVETGLQVKACLNAGCDHEVEEVIAIKADAHNLGGWVVTKAAKCTIPGEITRFCKNGSCEYKVTDSLDPDGKNHDFAEDFTVIESTCVAKGSKFKVCENEGCKVVTEKTEIAINPAAHKNIVTINAKEATCEEKGYTGDEFCNDCKKTVDPGIEINAKGHTESDWIVDKEATFTEEGARHTACTVCKKELKKEVIAKLTLATPSPKAYNKTGCIKVKWADVDNALTYNVYRSEYVNKKWTTWKRIASGVKQGVGYYNDKNVTEGKQYKYTVKAYNGDFVSGKKASNKLIFISPVKPSLTTTTTGIILKWNTVLGADKYIAYRSQIVDGKWSDWKKVVTITDGKSSWVDTTAESGVTYKYSVRVYKGSSYSNREASTSIIFLTQPTLKLSNTSTGIKGSWKTVNGATGYVVTRAEYNDSLKKYGPTVKIGTASGTAKSFTDKTAKAGVKYKYTITAINGSYSSIVSPAKSYRRLAQPTVTIENTNGAIKGSWTQVTGAASYIIYRSEVVNGKWSSWKNLGTAGATAKSFTDKTVKSGVKYKYRVIAKNGGSKSSAEASNKLVYLTCPKATVSNSIYGAKVKWNVITGAESYIVYRKSYVNKQWTAWQQIAKTSTNSYTDSTAVSGAKYRYTIHAVNDGSLSARKDSASFVYVEAPKTTTTVKAKAITLNWNEIGGAKKYVVYRAELGDDGKWSGWSKVASLKDVNTFADTTVVAGKTYKYKVNACIGKSKSSSNATSGVLVPKAQ